MASKKINYELISIMEAGGEGINDGHNKLFSI